MSKRMLSVVVLIALLTVGCQNAAQQVPVQRQAEHVVVEMVGMRFMPQEVVITPGTQVVFVNTDRQPHNVVHGTPGSPQREPLFTSPVLRAGTEWAYVFEDEGEYPFMCTINRHHLAGMVGTIVVRAAE